MGINLPVIKVGHRGIGEGYGENTLCSVEKAINIGMDMVELDVRITRDRVPVVIHDSSIDLDGRIVDISSVSWEDIQKVNIRTCERLSTLREMLEFIDGRIGVLLDLKESGCEEDVCAVLSDYVNNTSIIVTSFDAEMLMKISSILPGVKIGLMSIGLERELLSEVAPIFDVFLIYLPFLGKDIVEQIHNFGGEVFTWVVNTIEELKYAIMTGVDGVVMNNSKVLIEGAVK